MDYTPFQILILFGLALIAILIGGALGWYAYVSGWLGKLRKPLCVLVVIGLATTLLAASTNPRPTRQSFAISLPKVHATDYYGCCWAERDEWQFWHNYLIFFPDDTFAQIMEQMALARWVLCEACHPWPLCGPDCWSW